MGLSVACWGRWKHWLKVSAAYLALVCLTGVILTGSRGGVLSTACGLMVFLGLSLFVLKSGAVANKWLVTVCVILATAVLVGGAVYFMSNQMNLRLRWSNLQTKGSDRLDMWASAIKQFETSPAFGTGSGTYFYYQRHFRKPFEWVDAIYAHNDYLQLLAEFGLAGLVCFLIFFGSHLVHGVKSLSWFVTERLGSLGRIRSDTLALNIGALSALSTYVVHSVFDFNLHIPANALVLAIVFAILANPGVETPFSSGHFVRTSRYARLALPALGLWLGLVGLPTLPGEYFSWLAWIANTEERYEDGVRLALKGITSEKKNPDLYMSLGEGLLELGRQASTPAKAEAAFNAAVQAYRKGLAVFRQERYLLLGMGWSLDELKRYDEAEAYFKEVLAAEPNSAQLHAYYGTHLRAAGKLDEAEAEYIKSKALVWNAVANDGLESIARERAAASKPVSPP